jgi:hypothetical protein
MAKNTSRQRSRFEIICAEGRRWYELKTGQQLDAARFASWDTVEDVRNYIDQENNKFATYRKKNSKIYEQLKTTFTPVEKLGSLVTVGSSAGCPPAGACLGAAALLIRSAQNVSSHYDRVVDLFEMLAVSYILCLRLASHCS